MPELLLPLDLHLHHRVVSVFDALQGLLDFWKQVDNLLFADQDLTVRVRQPEWDVTEETQQRFDTWEDLKINI